MLENVIPSADNIVVLHLDMTDSGMQFRRIVAKRKNWFMQNHQRFYERHAPDRKLDWDVVRKIADFLPRLLTQTVCHARHRTQDRIYPDREKPGCVRGQDLSQSVDLPNLFASAGKELCDLLVVCGDDILIFSDKSIKWSSGVNVEVGVAALVQKGHQANRRGRSTAQPAP